MREPELMDVAIKSSSNEQVTTEIGAAGTYASDKRAIVVLGMHRSGMSALTRIINLLGVELGDDLLAASQDNEKGYFEHSTTMLLNQQVLERLGTSWDSATPLPEYWWDDPKIISLRNELLAKLRQDFDKVPLWGIKDPRLCRLLPMWKSIFAGLNSTPNYILMLRNPYGVAASLAKRNGFSLNKSLLLWLRYVLEAERGTRGSTRVFITYDEFMYDWQTAMEQVASGLDLKFLRLMESARGEISELLSPSLRHHKHERAASQFQPSIFSGWSDTVYRAMEAAAQGDESKISKLEEIDQQLQELCELLGKTNEVSPHINQAVTREEAYGIWVDKTALRERDGQLMAERMIKTWRSKPGIHLITVLRPGMATLLADTLDSLSSQFYTEWGLTVIATTACPDPGFEQQTMLEWFHFAGDPQTLMNKVVENSPADWIGVIEPGIRFEPHMLFSVADYINLHSEWRLIYTDEDFVGEDGTRRDPLFKPDFNLDMLHSMPYMGATCFIQRDALLKVGGFTSLGGVENYDAALKIVDSCGERAIGHIPKVLSHQPPQRLTHLSQKQIENNGRQVLQEHFNRQNIQVEVGQGLLPGTYRIYYSHDLAPLVSIIIPTKDQYEILKVCVESLLSKTAYKNFEVILVDNETTDSEAVTYLQSVNARFGDKVRVAYYPGIFNYSAVCNLGANEARGDFLLFLNNDTQIIQPSWLDNMMRHAQRKEIGITGARLVFPGTHMVQHSGIILGLEGGAGYPLSGEIGLSDSGYMGRAQIDQNLSAVSGACLLVRKTLYEQVGGMDDECFKLFYGDVDLCLKVGKAGFKVVWTPAATLVHHGTLTRNSDSKDPLKQAYFVERSIYEGDAMINRWRYQIANDPAYNPNLSLSATDFRVEADVVPAWDANFHDRPRILSFPIDNFGCGHYRVHGPLQALDAAALAQCQMMPKHEGVKNPRMPSIVELERMQPDVLLLESTMTDNMLAMLKKYKQHSSDVFRVFDLEDLKTDLPEKNSRRKYMHQDMAWRLRTALGLCDRLLVTTEPLAEAYRNYIEDIRILPNYLDLKLWGRLESQRRQGDKPRIGWAGAQQHHGDLEFLTDVVRATAGEVDWVFFGMCLDELRPYVSEVHDFVAFADYPAKLASLNLDLAVAPLEYHPFNEAKSNLRILEYGMMGWPVICTDIYPYQRAPVRRLPNQPQPWIAAILERAHDLDATAKEGDRLKQWVLNNWILQDHLSEILNDMLPTTVTCQSVVDGPKLCKSIG
jgi:GT2 family glycosyltransferase